MFKGLTDKLAKAASDLKDTAGKGLDDFGDKFSEVKDEAIGGANEAFIKKLIRTLEKEGYTVTKNK